MSERRWEAAGTCGLCPWTFFLHWWPPTHTSADPPPLHPLPQIVSHLVSQLSLRLHLFRGITCSLLYFISPLLWSFSALTSASSSHCLNPRTHFASLVLGSHFLSCSFWVSCGSITLTAAVWYPPPSNLQVSLCYCNRWNRLLARTRWTDLGLGATAGGTLPPSLLFVAYSARLFHE